MDALKAAGALITASPAELGQTMQLSSSTQGKMIRIPGRIPITIYPTFWIFAALIGYVNSQSFVGTLIWIGVIFVSVLFHEFGHALTAVAFGQNPRIELVAMGGLTYHDGQKLSFWKQFFIVLNGPVFGFLLFFITWAVLRFPSFSQGAVGAILSLTMAVNLFWSVINLLPVMPLDGGQLLRIVFEKLFGLKGLKYALIVGIVISLGFSLVLFLYQVILAGALFFLFAFQSYDTLKRTRHLTESDRNDSVRELLGRAEKMLQQGKKKEAAQLCEEVRKKAKDGLIFALATQYLAFLKYEDGLTQESYQLLLSVKDDLENEALTLLQKTAFDQRDFPLVVELAGTCFQNLPTAEIALLNACAHAELNQAQPAVGWLQTAIQEGLSNIEDIIKTPAFDPIRHDPAFEEFLKTHHKA